MVKRKQTRKQGRRKNSRKQRRSSSSRRIQRGGEVIEKTFNRLAELSTFLTDDPEHEGGKAVTRMQAKSTNEKIPTFGTVDITPAIRGERGRLVLPKYVGGVQNGTIEITDDNIQFFTFAFV
jgi:hypothetical protein